MKRCPNCGNKQFIAIGHVAEQWLVDEYGSCEQVISCIEVVHEPDDDDIWECSECGYEAVGREFNMKE